MKKSNEDWSKARTELARLIAKRGARGVTRDEARRIHKLQQSLWFHEKCPPKERWKVDSLPQQMFGKRIKDLTPDELYQYRHELYLRRTRGTGR